MTCPRLRTTSHVSNVDFDRYDYLRPEECKVIRDWFIQAWKLRDDFREAQRHQYHFEHTWEPVQNYHRYFEAFCFLWFSFNSWATCVCVTDDDRDSVYIQALIHADTIRQDFSRLTSNSLSPTGFYA